MHKTESFHVGDETLYAIESEYLSGNTCVIAEDLDGEVYAVLSVNMPNTEWLPKGIFFLKDWSENSNVAAAFIGSGLITKARHIMPQNSGFITATAYIWTDEAEFWEDQVATMYQGEDIEC